jgi:hypothetical protein
VWYISDLYQDPRYTEVAFWLSDGTTARKVLDIPLGQDAVVFVRNLISKSQSIQVDSMDIRSRVGEMHIIPSHVVAFIINP